MRDDWHRAGWLDRLTGKLPGQRVGAATAGLDPGFLRNLLRRLDDAGFGNLAHAILAAHLAVADGQRDREELDALIDLGLLLVRADPGTVIPIPDVGAAVRMRR